MHVCKAGDWLSYSVGLPANKVLKLYILRLFSGEYIFGIYCIHCTSCTNKFQYYEIFVLFLYDLYANNKAFDYQTNFDVTNINGDINLQNHISAIWAGFKLLCVIFSVDFEYPNITVTAWKMNAPV